ncbi:MAG: hypothetical protein AAF354_13985, partial [Pseudomonadota bacterium]
MLAVDALDVQDVLQPQAVAGSVVQAGSVEAGADDALEVAFRNTNEPCPIAVTLRQHVVVPQ